MYAPTGTVRILGYDYDVALLPRTEMQDCDGWENASLARIRVCDDLPDDRRREVTLHEVLHAVHKAVAVPLTEDQNAALSRALYAVCRENPEYMKRLLFPEPEPLRGGPGTITAAEAEDAARRVAARR